VEIKWKIKKKSRHKSRYNNTGTLCTQLSFMLVVKCISEALHPLGRYKFSFSSGTTAPSGPGPPHYGGFTITLRHTTLGRISLAKGLARCTDLYMTTHNTHKKQTSMSPTGFEPTIPASMRPQTYALDHAATGIGRYKCVYKYLTVFSSNKSWENFLIADL
jgi:hypothetical protein